MRIHNISVGAIIRDWPVHLKELYRLYCRIANEFAPTEIRDWLVHPKGLNRLYYRIANEFAPTEIRDWLVHPKELYRLYCRIANEFAPTDTRAVVWPSRNPDKKTAFRTKGTPLNSHATTTSVAATQRFNSSSERLKQPPHERELSRINQRGV
ncbi:MAG: hypothetical protein ACRER8_13970 [Pseudomonas sp.]|uniref:hypothetical protein n=1 Tax=Pseudomonas sp. TaxID=306 RepID=UPI003D6F124E